MSQLTEQQAYLAMYSFLETEYALSKSDEIGGLLGSMSLLADGYPADPAVLNQWKQAVASAVAGKVSAGLSLSAKG